MNTTKISEEKRTALYEVVIPAQDIKVRYDTALKKISQTADIEGFRKGKAPLEMVSKTIGHESIYDQLLQDLVSDVYQKILEKDSLRPFISPKIELKNAKEGEDWVINISIAIEPRVTLPDYKKIIADIRAETKKDNIWVPGKDEKTDAASVKKREKFLNAVLRSLIDKTQIELSPLIIDEEITQRLSRLVDDVRKIGLTIDAYLRSRQITQDKIKEEFTKDIIDTYKLEFALNEIGDKENITVEKEEIDTLLKKLPEKDRHEAEKNSYMYSAMIRKQKIIDFLGSS